MQTRLIREIAAEIESDWGDRIDNAARPYVSAMQRIEDICDDYESETAIEIVARFLSSAATWRGETARRVKAELNAMLTLADGARGRRFAL